MSAGGLQGCKIDARWAEKQSAARLTQACGEALAEARAELRRTDGSAAPDVAGRRAAGLAVEALALLDAPERLTGR